MKSSIVVCKQVEPRPQHVAEAYFRVAEARLLLSGINETWQLTLTEDGLELPDADVAVVSVAAKVADGELSEIWVHWRDGLWVKATEERKRTLDRLSQLADMIRSGKLRGVKEINSPSEAT